MTDLPFYFVVVFWGEEHRNSFVHMLVPSLLAPGNLPALHSPMQSRFLIVTTADDWRAIQSHPVVEALQRLIHSIHIEMAPPASGANKYLVMSEGHKRATMLAFADGAFGIFLTPDLVLSDGSIITLQRLAHQGKAVVLSVAMRFAREGCLREIDNLRGSSPDSALMLPPRTLAGIALRHMHAETLRYDWDEPYFAARPFSCFFRVPQEDGILVHSFSWAPVLVNYRNLGRHDTHTFESWTMDGDYIYRNFPEENTVHVISDSDELLLVSFTHANDRPGDLGPDSLRPRWYNRFPGIGTFWKVHALREVKDSAAMDPLKRRVLGKGIRIHSGEVCSSAWQQTERLATKIVAKVMARPTLLEFASVLIVRIVESGAFWPLSLLNRAGGVQAFAESGNGEFTNQSGVGSHRVWLIGRCVSSGKWYWEVASPNFAAASGSVANTASVGVLTSEHSVVKEVGSGRSGWGWRADGTKVHAGKRSTYGTAANRNGDVIMLALDSKAGKIWFGRNGVWFGRGDPMTGENPAFQGLQRPLFPALSSRHGGKGTATLRACVTPDSWSYPAPAGFGSLMEGAIFPAQEHLVDQAIRQPG